MKPADYKCWPKQFPTSLTIPRTTLWHNLEVAATRYPDKPVAIFYDSQLGHRPLAVRAATSQAPLVAAILGAMAILVLLRAAGDGAAAMNCLAEALQHYRERVEEASRSRPVADAQPEGPVDRLSTQVVLTDLDEVLDRPAGLS